MKDTRRVPIKVRWMHRNWVSHPSVHHKASIINESKDTFVCEEWAYSTRLLTGCTIYSLTRGALEVVEKQPMRQCHGVITPCGGRNHFKKTSCIFSERHSKSDLREVRQSDRICRSRPSSAHETPQPDVSSESWLCARDRLHTRGRPWNAILCSYGILSCAEKYHQVRTFTRPNNVLVGHLVYRSMLLCSADAVTD